MEMNGNIEEIEKLLVRPREWQYQGEVDIKKRPKNSLLTNGDIEFEQGVPLAPFSSKQNDEIERITLQRIREGTFDNHTYNTMQKVEVVEETYETADLEINEILSLYNEIEGDLMRMTDFGNNGFVPDCEIVMVKSEEPSKKRHPGRRSLGKIKNVTVLEK